MMVRSLAFSPDSARIASMGFVDGLVRIREIETGKTTFEVAASPTRNAPIAFHPTREIIAICEDNAVRLWDSQSSRAIALLQGHTSDILAIDFNHTGNEVASGSYDKTIRLWDIDTQAPIATLKADAAVTALEYSPNGSQLASGFADGIVRIWDLDSQKTVSAFNVGGEVSSIAFNGDGTRLATASEITLGEGRGIRLWDTKTGLNVANLRGQDEMISVAFSPDGTMIAGGSFDATITLWKSNVDATAEAVRADRQSFWMPTGVAPRK